jgi:dihydropteroate synthase
MPSFTCQACAATVSSALMNWNINGRHIDLTKRGIIMGILNTTPDSFSDGGTHATRELALQHALQMIQEGADIIDIGGESTRPGAPEVSAEEEIQRVIPVIESLRQTWSGLISIDTSKAIVAKAALLAGANIINDVSGLRHDPAMLDVCRETDCGIIIMHMRGNPRTMQVNPQYDDVVTSVREFFEERYQTLKHEGISADRLCFDPGIGFGKSAEHNWTLMENLHRLVVHHRPILLGVSKKSFIAKRTGSTDIEARSWPTIALTAYGREQGVMLHRVHDVKGNLDALRMCEAILATPTRS